MGIGRRDFFKLSALGAATALAGSVTASEGVESFDGNKAKGVMVDTVACIGCRKCEWACNDVNALPTQELKAFEDKSVFQKRRRPSDAAFTVVNAFPAGNGTGKMYTVKLQCMHCNDPACVSACIVGALKKTDRGPVVYDSWKCIGCRYCMVACPFQIPAYEYKNALDPQVRKCTFCSQRLEQGKRPACVDICPSEALIFGTREELIDLAQSRFRANPGRYVEQIYGEKEIGGTSWMYLAATDIAATGLPKLGDEPVPNATESIQHGIFKSFVPPLALYGLLGLVMHSLRDPDAKEGSHE